MRNFYEVPDNDFFDCAAYLNGWESFLAIFQKNEKEKKEGAQRLASQGQNIWKMFNEQRENLDKRYMDSAVFLTAYVALFLLPNAERVFSLLVKDENRVILETLVQKNKEEIGIIDFGCGPLSATVGAFAVFSFLFSKLNQNTETEAIFKIPKKITVYAVDRSAKAVACGKKLIEAALGQTCQVEIAQHTSAEKINAQVDLILCANVLNEIPEKHRLKTLNTLAQKLAPEGSLLILEPGQQNHAQALGALRNAFLRQTKDYAIVSPCPHHKDCPLAQNSDRVDWCWFRHGWNPPDSLAFLGRFCKTDQHELNFSYLFVQKTSLLSQTTAESPSFFARCVSDDFPIRLSVQSPQFLFFSSHLVAGDKDDLTALAEGSETVQKVLLCTREGTLESGFLVAEPEQKGYRRGRKILFSADFPLRAKERTSDTKP